MRLLLQMRTYRYPALIALHWTPNSTLMSVARMDQISLRAFNRLSYRDPRAVLVDMRRLELRIRSAEVDPRVRHLRTNDLRNVRELRSACLFCHGMSRLTGQKYAVAHSEAVDYDAVATWVRDGTVLRAIQLKEVPPTAHLRRAGNHQCAGEVPRLGGPHCGCTPQPGLASSELTIPPVRVAALSVSADQPSIGR